LSKGIELVVFDIAGTTLYDNNDVARTLIETLSTYGYEVSLDAVNNVMGCPKDVAIRTLIESDCPEDSLTKAVNDIHTSFKDNMMKFYAENESVRAHDGVAETFKELKARNIKVAIDTGFSRDITDVILARTGWLENDLIDMSICSDEVDLGRPHPDMIRKIMQELNIADAATVAKVGDTVSDVAEGRAAGCQFVIGVTTGTNTQDELALFEPTHIISHISEVIDIVA